MKVYRKLEELLEYHDKTSIAIGLFDGFHLGHHQVIQEAVRVARQKNYKSAVFTFQMSGTGGPEKVTRTNFQISSEQIFFNTLKELGIDTVVSLAFDDVRELYPQEFIEQVLVEGLQVQFISCGKDFRFGKNASGTWEDLKKYGPQYKMETVAVDLVEYQGEPISSTRIRECLRQGNMKDANAMLGHAYAIDFTVVGGNRIGRTLGTPTINQPYPEAYVVPKFGVYVTLTKVGELWYTSVTNVGTKPTIGDYDALAETYIQGFEGNLYGQDVQVDFIEFIRVEEKFDTMEELRQAILHDSDVAKEVGTPYLEKRGSSCTNC